MTVRGLGRLGAALHVVVGVVVLIVATCGGVAWTSVHKSTTATTLTAISYDDPAKLSPVTYFPLARLDGINASTEGAGFVRGEAVFVAADDEVAAARCGGQSFTADTKVVMADGSTKPLKQVKVRDKVEATDPASGKTQAQTVMAVWVNHDTDLMNVTIKAGMKTSVIQATQHHLFWDVTRKAWVEADKLVAGDQLQTDTGTVATVAGAVVVPGAADMWDLTVNNDHDFYVVTSSAKVLVHNCPDRGPKTGAGQSKIPSWYTNGGYGPEAGETPAQAATRILDQRYGTGNWKTGPTSDYNIIVKYISRRG